MKKGKKKMTTNVSKSTTKKGVKKMAYGGKVKKMKKGGINC